MRKIHRSLPDQIPTIVCCQVIDSRVCTVPCPSYTICSRTAKRKLDDTSFMGGILHVCYAPEFESIQDTRAKLDERLAVCEHGGKRFKRDPEVAACSSKEAVSNPAPQSNVSKSEAKSEDASASSTGKSTPRKKRADDKRKRI